MVEVYVYLNVYDRKIKQWYWKGLLESRLSISNELRWKKLFCKVSIDRIFKRVCGWVDRKGEVDGGDDNVVYVCVGFV